MMRKKTTIQSNRFGAGLRRRLLAIAKESGGYTLVETLVASAIFLGVLLPASLVLAKLAMSRYNHEVMIATQLAKDEMEKTLLAASFDSTSSSTMGNEKEVLLDGRRWRLARETQERFGLIEIHVRVFRNRETKPLIEFKTLRVPP